MIVITVSLESLCGSNGEKKKQTITFAWLVIILDVNVAAVNIIVSLV